MRILILGLLGGVSLLLGVWATGAAYAPKKAGKTSSVHSNKIVLVELFTSEGCSSCPSADAVLRKLVEKQPVDGVEILGLGFHVDYWNRLGWKDAFSDRAFTNRQYAYADRFGGDRVYTPQAIVQGRDELVGSRESELVTAIKEALPAQAELAFTETTDGVTVIATSNNANKQKAEIWIAEVETGLSTAVKKGENAGELLKHAPIVRHLTKIGALSQSDKQHTLRYKPIKQISGTYQLIAFVQEENAGPILAAARWAK